MVGVVGVGLFPAETPLHVPAVAAAYLGFMFAPVVCSIGALRAGERRFGVLSVFGSVVHLGSWVVWGVALTSVLPGLAVPEFVGALLFDMWALWVAQRAWRLA